MRLFLFSLALFAAATLGSSALAVVAVQDIKNLPGYSETNLVSGFTEFLQKNPAAFKKLENNSQLSQQIFRTPSLQRAMMQTAATQNNTAADTAQNNNRLDNNTSATISDDARREIERMRKTYQRTKEDPEFAKYAASAENEGAQQQQSTAETPTETADASDDTATFDNAPFSITNVNAIPTVAGLEPDANGWPKYLNAPAHCKPPSPKLTYLYEFRFKHEAGRPLRPSAAGRLSANDNDTVIANYFYPYSLGLGDVRDVYLKANESLAIPFVASRNVSIGQHIYRDSSMDRIVSISECPGDIGDPYNGNTLGRYCVGTDAGENDSIRTTTLTNSSGGCRIEHGKRYFFNILPTTPVKRLVDNTPENQRRRELEQQRCHTGNVAIPKMCIDGSLSESSSICYHQADKGDVCIRQENGRTLMNADGSTRFVQAPANYYPQIPDACINKPCKIAALSIGGAHPYRLKPVPYNGPCLQQGPFPLNYNSTTCGRSFNGRTCARDGSVTIECADPQNELDTVRLVQGCRTGANPIWLEGYGKPIHSRLQCSVTNIENAPTYDHASATQNPEIYRQRYFFLEGYLDYPETANQTGGNLQAGLYAPPSSAPSNAYGQSTNTLESTDEAQAKPSQYTFGSDNTNDIRIGGGKESRIPEAANMTSGDTALAKDGASATTSSGAIRSGLSNMGRTIGNNLREDFRNIGNGIRDTGTNLRNLLSSSSGASGSGGNNNAPIFSGGFEGGSGDNSSDTSIFNGGFEEGSGAGDENSSQGNSSGGGSSSGSRGAEMQRQINMQREIDSALREAEMLKNWQTKGGAQQQR